MRPQYRDQRGAALLAMAAILVMGASWALLNALAPQNRTAANREHNARVLARAKEALLGDIALLAVTDNYPGRLRCPEPVGHVGDARYEGIAAPYPPSGQATCSSIGRLPWRTIGVERLHDADGEPLWYAVTTGAAGWALQNSSTVLSINPNKAGTLTVNGDTVVAAIIAPGRAFNVNPTASQVAAGCAARVQSRTSVAADYRDYIECSDSATGVFRSSVVDNASNPVVNDQVVVITAAEVMAAIEPVVAKRIENEIVPQLQAAYSGAQWGGQIIFPYAARFETAGAFNPDGYKGTYDQKQGLLPFTAYTCNSLTTGRCDPTFVQWTLGSISVTKTGGSATLGAWTCAASTTSQVRCTIPYSLLVCALMCAVDIGIRVEADGTNVSRALRRLDMTQPTVAAVAPSTAGAFTASAALRPDAAASGRIEYNGVLQGGSAGICWPAIGLLCSGTAVITIPIGVFADHALINPATSDAFYWFAANKWQEVTYYAVAPSHLANGAVHNCSSAADCLSLTGGTPSANIRAMLVLAGRSLSGTARPNGTLSDFLEDASNRDGDRTFVWSQPRRASYNDRFVSAGNY